MAVIKTHPPREPEAIAPPPPLPVVVPAFPGLPPLVPDQPAQTVTLIGAGPIDGAYQVATPIPQDLAHGAAIYNLSDRARGVYSFRVK